MNRPSPRPRARRRGFTLVELLIVIVIIGILVALLIPVLAGAMRTARTAQVSGEINNLVAALTQFKNQYGDYPPSRMILSETGAYDLASTASLASVTAWHVGTDGGGSPILGSLPAYYFGTPDLTFGQLCQRSVRHLQKFFPKLAPANLNAAPPVWHDFNGNGVPDAGYIYLQGHECLAFFLGGIPQPSVDPNGDGQPPFVFATGDTLVGFGKDPRFPFKTSATLGSGGANPMATGNRSPALYEFLANRLVDEDGDGIPGYVHPLHNSNEGRFYAYFSAYGTGSYDPNDVNFAPADPNYPEADDAQQPLIMPFVVNFTYAPGNTNGTASVAPNPYTGGSPVPSNANQAASFLNPKSFQILSPGVDGRYGLGGQYDATSTGERLPWPPPNPNFSWPGFSGNVRVIERDNVTNFSQGALE